MVSTVAVAVLVLELVFKRQSVVAASVDSPRQGLASKACCPCQSSCMRTRRVNTIDLFVASVVCGFHLLTG